MNTQRRAATGGETGANGEWYEGGKFIATTDRAKSSKENTVSTRRQNSGPGFWIVAPEPHLLAIWPCLAGIEILNRSTGKFSFNADLRNEYAKPEAIANRMAKINAYNNGERWFNPNAKDA